MGGLWLISDGLKLPNLGLQSDALADNEQGQSKEDPLLSGGSLRPGILIQAVFCFQIQKREHQWNWMGT